MARPHSSAPTACAISARKSKSMRAPISAWLPLPSNLPLWPSCFWCTTENSELTKRSAKSFRIFRIDFAERFVSSEFSVVHQKHDGHSGKLLGKGSQAEIGARIDFDFRAEITHAVGALECGLAIVAHQHRETRRVRGSQGQKKLIYLLLHKGQRGLLSQGTCYT